MPWYRDVIDLNQKQLLMVSIATTFFKGSFAHSFIIVNPQDPGFYPVSLVEIMTLVVKL